MDVTPFPADSPASKILDYLHRNGEATVKDLEDVLGVSTTAVREHLTNLQARGLLATRQERQGPGRPKLVFFLTSNAQQLIPKSYDTLITLLMREIATREGPEELQKLLDAVGQKMADQFRGQVSGDDTRERLNRLRAVMESRGIPAEASPSGEALQVFACPYHDVAQEHAGLCTMERQMLEKLVGEQIRLDGTIREGRRSCQFKVESLKQSH